MEEARMMDARFWTVCEDVDELISTVDIDGVEDIETLLMILFGRPIGVACSWNDHAECANVEITIAADTEQFVSVQAFPLSVVQLVRSCAELDAAAGPHAAGADSPAGDSPEILSLSDEALTTSLQQALGKVRVYNMMYPDEEP